MKEDLIYIIAFILSILNLALTYIAIMFISKYHQQKHISAQLLKRKESK